MIAQTHLLRRLIAPGVIIWAAAGCSSSDAITPDMCNVKVVDVTPLTATIHPTDVLTFHVSYTAGISAACTPNVPATALRWTSSDPLVASVDSVSGEVTANGVGTATVGVHLPGTSQGLASVPVMVVAP